MEGAASPVAAPGQGGATTPLCPVVAGVSLAAQVLHKVAMHVAVFAGGEGCLEGMVGARPSLGVKRHAHTPPPPPTRCCPAAAQLLPGCLPSCCSAARRPRCGRRCWLRAAGRSLAVAGQAPGGWPGPLDHRMGRGRLRGGYRRGCGSPRPGCAGRVLPGSCWQQAARPPACWGPGGAWGGAGLRFPAAARRRRRPGRRLLAAISSCCAPGVCRRGKRSWPGRLSGVPPAPGAPGCGGVGGQLCGWAGEPAGAACARGRGQGASQRPPQRGCVWHGPRGPGGGCAGAVRQAQPLARAACAAVPVCPAHARAVRALLCGGVGKV